MLALKWEANINNANHVSTLICFGNGLVPSILTTWKESIHVNNLSLPGKDVAENVNVDHFSVDFFD